MQVIQRQAVDPHRGLEVVQLVDTQYGLSTLNWAAILPAPKPVESAPPPKSAMISKPADSPPPPVAPAFVPNPGSSPAQNKKALKKFERAQRQAISIELIRSRNPPPQEGRPTARDEPPREKVVGFISCR